MERIIRTRRLIARPLRVEDAGDAFEWLSDPAVNRFMRYSLYETAAQAADWIASVKDAEYEFAVTLKEGGKVIGSGGIYFVPEKGAWALGYNFNRAYWGRGYATEFAKAVLRWGRETAGIRDFCAAHADANAASGAVLKKCGFRFERHGTYARLDGSETFPAAFYTLRME